MSWLKWLSTKKEPVPQARKSKLSLGEAGLSEVGLSSARIARRCPGCRAISDPDSGTAVASATSSAEQEQLRRFSLPGLIIDAHKSLSYFDPQQLCALCQDAWEALRREYERLPQCPSCGGTRVKVRHNRIPKSGSALYSSRDAKHDFGLFAACPDCRGSGKDVSRFLRGA